MNRSLLVAAMLAAFALAACNKKEEAPVELPAPAVTPALPSAAETAPEQSKPADAAPAPLDVTPEQKPDAEAKPNN